MWLVGEGGIYGNGCMEVYRFPHTTFPYSSCIFSFLQQHPYFLFIFLNVFRSCIIILQVWCSLKSVTTTLGLLFSWLHILHCTVVITLGNLASFSSYSCLVYIIL